MITFIELEKMIKDRKYTREVLSHVVEYIDENFRSVAGNKPINTLLTREDNVPVPESTFEAVSSSLTEQISNLTAVIEHLNSRPIEVDLTKEETHGSEADKVGKES